MSPEERAERVLAWWASEEEDGFEGWRPRPQAVAELAAEIRSAVAVERERVARRCAGIVSTTLQPFAEIVREFGLHAKGPCPHPARHGVHEFYMEGRERMVCRACGASVPRPEPQP